MWLPEIRPLALVVVYEGLILLHRRCFHFIMALTELYRMPLILWLQEIVEPILLLDALQFLHLAAV